MSISLRDLKYLLEIILQCERDETGKHIKYYLKVDGRTVAWTMYSHSWRGNMQIDDSMLNMIAKQMKCSSKTWKLLLQGRISKEAYFKELLQNGHISQQEFDELCYKGN